MARKTSRRGGAWYDPRTWLTKSPEQKAKECEDAKKKKDEVCAGESSAADVPTTTPVTDTTAPAAPASPQSAGRSRRRRQTRRKYKGGKHRKSH
jgi:hypothetical protein